MKSTWVFVGSVLLASIVALPARALGPVDGEVTALYWLSETEIDGNAEDSAAAGGRAEIWFLKRLGLAGAVLRTEPEGPLAGSDLEYRSFDVKWRLLGPSANNFFAVGLGWEAIELAQTDADGLRAVAEGRIGLLKLVYLYGRAAYYPALDGDGRGRELEAGIQLKPAPFLQIFAGYRSGTARLDAPAGRVEIEASGPLAGIGINF